MHGVVLIPSRRGSEMSSRAVIAYVSVLTFGVLAPVASNSASLPFHFFREQNFADEHVGDVRLDIEINGHGRLIYSWSSGKHFRGKDVESNVLYASVSLVAKEKYAIFENHQTHQNNGQEATVYVTFDLTPEQIKVLDHVELLVGTLY